MSLRDFEVTNEYLSFVQLLKLKKKLLDLYCCILLVHSPPILLESYDFLYRKRGHTH